MRKRLNVISMKKLIFIFLVFPCLSYSQDSTSRWSLGLAASTDLCYRWLTVEDDLSAMKDVFDSLERPKFGYGIGGILGYSINSKNSIQAGLGFSNKGYAIDTLIEARMYDIVYNYNYIEIPFKYIRKIKEVNNFHPFFSIGINTDIFLSQKFNYRLFGLNGINSFNDNNSISKAIVGASVSIGFQKIIQSKFIFQLEINMRQWVNPLVQNPSSRYLNSAGFSFAFMRKF